MNDKYNDFPKTTNKRKWSEYLNRDLNNDEECLLDELKKEMIVNNMLSDLNKVLEGRNNIDKLYIPLLTKIDGNCLFESLVYHGIGNDIKSLRSSLGYLIYQLQDSYLPDQNKTIREMYDTFFCDDINFVYCNEDKKIYKYNYNLMCIDITSMNSWDRLPTNLILVIISWIFKLKIIILSDNTNYENIINAYDSSEENNTLELKEIYLGKIGGEFHYLPLDIVKTTNKNLKYNDIKRMFIKWGYYMSKRIKKN
jgi:hypothetical protein